MNDERKVKLNLLEVDGNAFCLMGAFQKAAKKQGFAKEWIDSIIEKCKSGNYDNLVATLFENTEA